MTVTVGAGGTLSSGEYLGRVLGRCEAPGFAATETSYRAGEDLPPHAHERAFFCLTLAGGYTERTAAFHETLYAPFTAVFHPAGEVHVTRMTEAGGRIFNVEIEPGLLALAGGRELRSARDLDGGTLVWLLARLRRVANVADPDAAREAESLGLELVGEALRSPLGGRGEPPWIARIVERLRDDPEERLSVAALAREAGVHPVHLARVFRRHRGETIASYARRVRVQRAARALARSGAEGDNLATIAAGAGFADQSHMTRAFRRVTGTTPAQLRGQPAQLRGQDASVRPRSSSSLSR